MSVFMTVGVLLLLMLAGALLIVVAGRRDVKQQLDLSELERWEAARAALRNRDGVES